MTWKNILKEDLIDEDDFDDLFWEGKPLKPDMKQFIEGVDMIYEVINKYHEKGVLDYDEHLMEFTKVIDSIADTFLEKLDRGE